MRDKILYEYVIETKDSNGDIINKDFCDTLKELNYNLPIGVDYDIALVRTTGNDNEGVKDKSYAYFTNSKLPLYFDDGIKIPRRYL